MAKAQTLIIKLTKEDISLVARGGSEELHKQLGDALKHAEENDQALFVRFNPEELQVQRVPNKDLAEHPEIEEYLRSEEAWV